MDDPSLLAVIAEFGGTVDGDTVTIPLSQMSDLMLVMGRAVIDVYRREIQARSLWDAWAAGAPPKGQHDA